MDGMRQRARLGSAPSLPETKRARVCARAVLLPLLAAATVLVSAVAAQAGGCGSRRPPAAPPARWSASRRGRPLPGVPAGLG